MPSVIIISCINAMDKIEIIGCALVNDDVAQQEYEKLKEANDKNCDGYYIVKLMNPDHINELMQELQG